MTGWDDGRGFVGAAVHDLAEILVDGFCEDLKALWRWVRRRNA